MITGVMLFAIGCIIGGCIGIVICSLAVAASRIDKDYKEDNDDDR